MVRNCQHIMGTGLQCCSPAMRTSDFCYYHRRLHDTWVLPGHPNYEPPALDDNNSVQIAVSHIYRALGKGLLDPKLGSCMLHAAQIAHKNLKDCHMSFSSLADYTPGMRRVLNLQAPPVCITLEADEANASQVMIDTSSIPQLQPPPGPAPVLILRASGHQSDGPARPYSPLDDYLKDYLRESLPPEGEPGTEDEQMNLKLLSLDICLSGIANPTTKQVYDAMDEIEQEPLKYHNLVLMEAITAKLADYSSLEPAPITEGPDVSSFSPNPASVTDFDNLSRVPGNQT